MKIGQLMKQLNASSLHAVRNLLEGSLLTNCDSLVIIKPERAMRTDLDIGVVIADLLQLAHFWLCITAQPLYNYRLPITRDQEELHES